MPIDMRARMPAGEKIQLVGRAVTARLGMTKCNPPRIICHAVSANGATGVD